MITLERAEGVLQERTFHWQNGRRHDDVGNAGDGDHRLGSMLIDDADEGGH